MTTHDPFTDRLSDYLDDELPPQERETVTTHLGRCDGCRTLLHELRAVRTRASTLEDPAAPADLWPGIVKRITDRHGAVVAFPARRTFSFTLPQLVAASLALMVLSGGMVWLARLGGERTDFPAIGANSPLPAASPVNFAEEHYDQAIADLQDILQAGRARLDPQTVRVLEANLESIDSAIDQCRRALAGDPGNVYLNVHLADARKRKLALLRDATALTGT